VVVRALIDTNVLVSAAYFGGKPGHVLQLAHEHRFHAMTSLHILEEFRDVVMRPGFGATRAEAEDGAIALAEFMAVVPVQRSSTAFTSDPNDDPVILAAIVGNADTIVTGDANLLGTESLPVRVTTVAGFLAELETTGSSAQHADDEEAHRT